MATVFRAPGPLATNVENLPGAFASLDLLLGPARQTVR
jgi:hypothetical protein